MSINALKERRASKTAEMRTLNDKASAEKRDLSENELARFTELETEVRGLTDQISRAERLDEFERFETATPNDAPTDMRNAMARYSVAKAINEQRSGHLTGVEAEFHAELSKDRGEVRGVMIPTDILFGGETRALTTTTPNGGPGGNMVVTDLGAMTDRRRAVLAIERMGATVLRGLTGNLDLPRLASSGSAGWVAEHVAAGRSDAQFSKASMGPKTVTAEYEVSRLMLKQSLQALEPILRADLAFLLAQAMDKAAIVGGGADEPTGIIADANVLTVPGGAFDSDITADLIAALETDDVSGTRAFLTNPGVMKAARKKKDADGRVIPVAELFHAERVETSTQVPADIGVGDDKNALIYGEWASLYLGYWSGVDIMVNPYHSDVASKGGALYHAFLDCDVLVRHPEGFRYAEID